LLWAPMTNRSTPSAAAVAMITSGPRQDDHRGDAVAPLPQVAHVPENVGVVPQEVFIIEDQDLGHVARRAPRLPGHGRRDELLGRDEQQRCDETQRLRHGTPPLTAWNAAGGLQRPPVTSRATVPGASPRGEAPSLWVGNLHARCVLQGRAGGVTCHRGAPPSGGSARAHRVFPRGQCPPDHGGDRRRGEPGLAEPGSSPSAAPAVKRFR
jgi:hypothetical protein